MNEIIEREEVNVKDMIYQIRGKYVMVDSDLARLYNCKNGTKDINKAVKRNIERFPEDFYFQLSKDEIDYLKYNDSRFQFGTLNENQRRGKNIKYLPYVFTEQGATMLSAILRTEIATMMSIRVIRAFVEMRKIISSNLIEQKYINNQVIKNADNILKNTEDIRLIQKSLDKMNKNKEYDGIFFKNQIYDSYSLLIDIFSNAKKKIIIIDNYIDKGLLDILRDVDKDILIVTNKFNNSDYTKYQLQYNNIKLKVNNNIHDRFIIIDEKELYHCGASFKDLGKKCFAINKIDNISWIKQLLIEVGEK